MENIVTKKFNYDHLSSYKTRGKLGASINRNARAQLANENRHLSRMDKVSKRRKMPLSPLADENVVDTITTVLKTKTENQEENLSQPELSRKEKLLKWREERKQKKQAETQRKSFVVRHIKHDKDANLFSAAVTKASNGVGPLMKPAQFTANKSTKRMTRASARLAKEVSAQLDDDRKGIPVEKGEVKSEKTGIVTNQRSRARAPSVTKANQVAPQPKSQVKTRSQAKKLKDQPLKETAPTKLEKNEKQKKQLALKSPINCEIPKLPEMDSIKNTVSIGRGSTEGVERVKAGATSSNGTSSFAPTDFQFTAPNGVNTFTYLSKTFTFQPLSPNSAVEFMFPSSAASFFSPKKPTEKPAENVILEDPVAAFNKPIPTSKTEQQHTENADSTPSSTAHDVPMETCNEAEQQESTATLADNENTAKSTDTQDQPGMVIGEVVTEIKSDSVEPQDTGSELQDTANEQHDAVHFRNLVKKETDRLNDICKKWEKVSSEEEDLSEEVTGQIRTTIGQAQLLIDQRFRQFSGLIDLSEDKNAEKQATASDLQGFWEMVYFQVEDVNSKFDALEKLKENNWKEEETKSRKVIRKTKPKKAVAVDGAKGGSKLASTRSRIQEMRMAMKAKMAADKEKLTAEKRHQEEEAFITILTPVKKSKKYDDSDEVVLTPVRRSIRRTPVKQSAFKSIPMVTTPKIIREDSPGLRLTPDNADNLNELAVIGIAMKTEETAEDATLGETCESVTISEICEKGTEMGPQMEEDRMECDLGQKAPVALKSACKSANSKSRMFSVTFQSPTELEDQQKTPASPQHEEATLSVNSSGVFNSTETREVTRRKKGTPQRFLARKCRRRVSTPYYHDRTRRRVSAVRDSNPAESESQSSGDSDSSDAKAKESCSVSGLRRSLRRTPSKYRDSTPLEAQPEHEEKIPGVSLQLFHVSEETAASDTLRNNSEEDAFSKYLCSSSSDNEERAEEPSDHTAENMVDDNDTTKNDSFDKEEETFTPLGQTQDVTRPTVPDSASRTGRTPIHLLKYLADADTPSPNSRQITPMPKTTIFVSPPDCSKTPSLADSLGTMSPEDAVHQLSVRDEGSSLLSLSGVAEKESQGSVTPSIELDALTLDSPMNDEKRRDSVFFAPVSSFNASRVQENLMCFSPVVERDEEGKE